MKEIKQEYEIKRDPIDGLLVLPKDPLPRKGNIYEIAKRSMRRIVRSGK